MSVIANFSSTSETGATLSPYPIVNSVCTQKWKALAIIASQDVRPD